jgi:hypothetical protein
MKIKLSEEQYKALINEIGGYDDPIIGMQDESSIIKQILEAHTHLKQGMDILTRLIPGIIVQDRLRSELSYVRNQLVDPMNEFNGLLRRIMGNQGQGHEIDRELDESKKKSKKKKDACYYKVKSRYKVWPSAYASGALVKCRKVGAKNWGNSTNESEEIQEKWSKSEREKRAKNCDNPKGFTMQQFCKNQKTRSKEGEKLNERKLTSKPSSETSLRDWFKRKGAKGSTGGWVDCNSPDGKGGYKSCGRQEGEKRSKYPACRPTPSACKKYKKTKGKSWGKKASKNESISEGLQYHINNNIPLVENIYRWGSEGFFNLINETRELYYNGDIELNSIDKELIETNIGEKAIFENKKVWLDIPMEDIEYLTEEDKFKGKKSGSPQRDSSGGKAYKVHVAGCAKKTDTNPRGIKLIRFGSGGLKAKLNNPEAKKSFNARHGCSEGRHNDKCKAGYWSCRLPRYAKALGLSGGGTWW